MAIGVIAQAIGQSPIIPLLRLFASVKTLPNRIANLLRRRGNRSEIVKFVCTSDQSNLKRRGSEKFDGMLFPLLPRQGFIWFRTALDDGSDLRTEMGTNLFDCDGGVFDRVVKEAGNNDLFGIPGFQKNEPNGIGMGNVRNIGALYSRVVSTSRCPNNSLTR